jgi:hypothetical protein
MRIETLYNYFIKSQNQNEEFFSPANYANCQFWLNSDNVILSGSKITQMTDMSGNNNHFVQSNNSNRADIESNVLNTYAGIKFTGANSHFYDATIRNIVANASGLTTFLVFKPTTPSSLYRIFNISTTTGSATRYSIRTQSTPAKNTQVVRTSGGGFIQLDTVANYSTSNFISLCCLHNNLTNLASNYINSALDVTNTNLNNGLTAYPNETPTLIQIGNMSNISGNFFDGYLMELIFFNRPLSTVEIEEINVYLKNKYAI